MRRLTPILAPIFLLGACSPPDMDRLDASSAKPLQIESVPGVTENTQASASAVTDTDMPGTSSVTGAVTGLMTDEQAFIRVGGSTEFTEVAADGSYEVRSIPVGDDIFVAVSTDTGRSSFDRVDIIEGQKAILDFDLEGPGRLFGRITRGGRVTATRIKVRSSGDGQRLSAGGPTSREGHYDIAGLPLGEYEVSVLSRPHFYVPVNGETWLDVDLCNLPTPQTSAPVGKASVCDNLSLSGVVVASEDGRGLERATMSIVGETGFGTQTATDGQGAFEFRDLAPGSYLLTVYRPGHEIVTRPILLQASMEGVTVMLEPTSGQTVRVRDRETGEPLGGSLQIEATNGSRTARFRLPLAADGAAVLPTSLYGHDLAIGSVGYRTHHMSDWNGEPLSLALSTCQLFSKGCYPHPCLLNSHRSQRDARLDRETPFSLHHAGNSGPSDQMNPADRL